jgi:FkbM family methyltransferase
MDEMTMSMHEAAVKAWVGIWYVMYVVLRVLLRVLIGRRRRKWIQFVLGLHYSRAFTIRYGQLCGTSYEPAVSRIIHKVLRKREAKIFIDVGEFIGWFSLYAYRILRKRKGAIVIAVEPDPKNYVALLENTMLCQFIKTMNVAIYISDKEEIEFHLGRKDSGGLSQSGSIYPTYHNECGLLSGESIFVKTIRLDTLIKRSGLERVNLIKMDIEGAEYPVLTDPLLDLSKVENMVVEVHYRYGSRESREIMQALAQHGFKIVPLYPDLNSNRFHLLACRGEVQW